MGMKARCARLSTPCVVIASDQLERGNLTVLVTLRLKQEQIASLRSQ
jgi:hypothetical protein